MYTVFIEGKERKLKAKAGSVIRISRKYKKQLDSLTAVVTENKEVDGDLDDGEFLEFVFEMVWELLVPNFLGIKPFITYDRFKENVDNLELNEASKKAFFLLRGIPVEEYNRIQEQGDRERKKVETNSTP